MRGGVCERDKAAEMDEQKRSRESHFVANVRVSDRTLQAQRMAVRFCDSSGRHPRKGLFYGSVGLCQS
jgi:hypothetical protein